MHNILLPFYPASSNYFPLKSVLPLDTCKYVRGVGGGGWADPFRKMILINIFGRIWTPFSLPFSSQKTKLSQGHPPFLENFFWIRTLDRQCLFNSKMCRRSVHIVFSNCTSYMTMKSQYAIYMRPSEHKCTEVYKVR